MADYVVHGKKGNGKSLVCVGRMRDALMAGRPVATNLDLYLEHMLPAWRRDVMVYRLPDRPTAEDLHVIGLGSKDVDESTYGEVVLDECATMLNARTFNDKSRAPFLDWFVHSRKLGWNSHFICQNPVQIDKQVRESLVELSASCKRMDRLRIPFLGALTNTLFGFEIRPPKVHVATVRYGSGNDALVSDRWVYTGTDLYKAYNTRQVFREDYEDGIYCLLSPWHLSAVVSPPGSEFVGPLRPGKTDWILTKGRAVERKRGKHAVKYIGLVLALGVGMGFVGHKYLFKEKPVEVAKAAPVKLGAVAAPGERKYSESVKAAGFFRSGAQLSVLLSDGRVVVPLSSVTNGAVVEAEITPGVWVKGGE